MQDENKKSFFAAFWKDKSNRILFFILLIGIIVRLYYFILTKGQALWWDESEYLVTAKHWALGVPWDVNAQRPILFPSLFALFYKLHISDLIGKFFFVFLPSAAAIVISYLLAKEMYDKKIALFTAGFIALFHVILFNTTRFHTDALSLLLGLLAVYFFWRGYVNEKSKKLVWLVGIFLALNFATRLVAVLIAFSIALFLLITTGIKFLKNKDLWISLVLGLIPLGTYLLYNIISYKNIFAFTAGYIRPQDIASISSNPLAWYVFSFVSSWFLGLVMFIVFLIGVLSCYKVFIGYDLIIKEKDKKSYADIFLLIVLIIHIIWFVFIQRAAEDRWLLPISFALFALASKGLILIYDNIKKYSKLASIAAVAVLLALGAYHQLSSADKTIKSKVPTYSQEPLAGNFLEKNTNTQDSIVSNNEVAPLSYYAERRVFGFVDSKESTINQIKKERPKYLVLTNYAPSRSWTNEFLEEYQNKLTPVQIYTETYNGQQVPVVIIYSFKDYNF